MIDTSKIIITIDRSQAERRYQLQTRNDDGSFNYIGGPLSPEDFYKTHGFSHKFPHGQTKDGH